jgi:uncharacterized protein (TIGR02145 family)
MRLAIRHILIINTLVFLLFTQSCKEENIIEQVVVDNYLSYSITTTAVSSITTTTAISGGNILYDGGSQIIERGVCWDTLPNPTILSSRTFDGVSVGVYVSNIVGLIPSKKYYLRAYASSIDSTMYGNEIAFTTNDSIPSGGGGGGGSGNPCIGGPTSVTDIDGNVYNVVTIGTQCWTKENLKTTRYRNGTVIPANLSPAQWNNTLSGAVSFYNNDTININTYGRLYNWYAVVDTSGLCPTGWHVPNDDEWNVLIKYLDQLADTSKLGVQSLSAGGILKEVGLANWLTPNVGANDSVQFTGLPGGYKLNTGSFSGLGSNSFWWSINAQAPQYAYYFNLYFNDSNASKLYGLKRYGFSVRCVRD